MSNKDYIAECSKHFTYVVNENYFRLKQCEGLREGDVSI